MFGHNGGRKDCSGGRHSPQRVQLVRARWINHGIDIEAVERFVRKILTEWLVRSQVSCDYRKLEAVSKAAVLSVPSAGRGKSDVFMIEVLSPTRAYNSPRRR